MSLKDCEKGNHSLIVIFRVSQAYDEEVVVRWCKTCGAVVKDLEIDNRLFPGYYMQMRLPKITKDSKGGINCD